MFYLDAELAGWDALEMSDLPKPATVRMGFNSVMYEFPRVEFVAWIRQKRDSRFSGTDTFQGATFKFSFQNLRHVYQIEN